jgi:hypothetical protein
MVRPTTICWSYHAIFTISGSSTEVSELTQTLTSVCNKAEEKQNNNAAIRQASPINDGKDKSSVDLSSACTENQTVCAAVCY